MRTGLPVLAAVLVLVCLSRLVVAENWAQFRGPNANGIVHAKELPTEWGVGTNIAWKVKLPGVGWSQPIVWGDKVFVTTAVTDNQEKPRGGQSGPGFSLFSTRGISRAFFNGGGPPNVTYRWKVLCLDGSRGNVVWEQVVRESRPNIPIHRSNTYASETPVTDGEHLIVHLGMTGLYCFDLSGELLWTKVLGSFPMQYGWGTGSSPVLHGDRVFVQCDNEEASFLVALDKKTGSELWRVERDEKSNWSTPYIWKNKVRSELVTCGGNKTRSYRLDNGELLWEMNASGRCATTPVSDEELIYVGSIERMMGRSQLLAAIRAGATGDISLDGEETANSFVAWSARRAAPPVASPLLFEGCLYALEQYGGIIRCFDAKTGKLHYRQRLPQAAGFTSSPWASDGKVFCLDENGQTVVLKAGSEMEVVATNKLDEMFWSSPAVLGEKLLLRGVDHLYCITK